MAPHISPCFGMYMITKYDCHCDLNRKPALPALPQKICQTSPNLRKLSSSCLQNDLSSPFISFANLSGDFQRYEPHHRKRCSNRQALGIPASKRFCKRQRRTIFKSPLQALCPTDGIPAGSLDTCH